MRPMKLTRSTFTVEPLGGDIYVIGSFDGVGLAAEVDWYSASTDTWNVVAPPNGPLSATLLCLYRLSSS
ncbi:hypothetical protein HPB48_018706 [Haemaphysalis longicornis]|uniref:Kelch repeat protein n=1 Tax=Haemaphysalis longicornis TaxID=44386 RepID=A0A9J6FQK8_HAELO|nr:hypothetical protein HPB48_018706 [Haemaphysalis longicornis]